MVTKIFCIRLLLGVYVIILLAYMPIVFTSDHIAFAQIGSKVCDPDESYKDCLASGPTFVMDGISSLDIVLFYPIFFLLIPIPVLIILIKNRNKLIYPKLVGAILISVSIFLFSPMAFTVFAYGLITVFQPEKLNISQAVPLIWEISVINFAVNIPAIVLFVLGIIFLRKTPLVTKHE